MYATGEDVFQFLDHTEHQVGGGMKIKHDGDSRKREHV